MNYEIFIIYYKKNHNYFQYLLKAGKAKVSDSREWV